MTTDLLTFSWQNRMVFLRILKKHGLKLLTPFLGVALIYWIWVVPPKYMGYAPDQPIPFSHKIHAGENKIECQFCHATVERSAHASVPDTATCMRCHQEVAPDSPSIQFLKSSFEQGLPLRWNKVHDLPDHVKFSHKPHIAKGVSCETCHGPIDTMDKVRVHSGFNMGWCVNCHREYSQRLQAEPPGDNVTVHLTECSTCHY